MVKAIDATVAATPVQSPSSVETKASPTKPKAKAKGEAKKATPKKATKRNPKSTEARGPRASTLEWKKQVAKAIFKHNNSIEWEKLVKALKVEGFTEKECDRRVGVMYHNDKSVSKVDHENGDQMWSLTAEGKKLLK